MKLKSAALTDGYPITRLCSENEIWELGISYNLYNFVIGAGKVGGESYEIYYEAGIIEQGESAKGFTMLMLFAVQSIFTSVPESLSCQQLNKLFPKPDRQLNQDFECWEKVVELGSHLSEIYTAQGELSESDLNRFLMEYSNATTDLCRRTRKA